MDHIDITGKTPFSEDFFMEIPLAALLQYWDPMKDDIWGCGPIDENDVRTWDGTPKHRHMDDLSDEFSDYDSNVARIHYLLTHGWSDFDDDSFPVTVDVGPAGRTPSEMVLDGNHRIAAATLRGDTHMTVAIQGSIPKARAVFLDGVHIDDWMG